MKSIWPSCRVRTLIRHSCSVVRSRFIQWMTILLTVALLSTVSAADSLDIPLIYEPFDRGLTGEAQSSERSVELRGARLVGDGPWGQSLRLDSGTSAALSNLRPIRVESGTLSIWLQPFWKESDEGSHTFLSFAWDHPKQSYFTISQGWWEPQGAKSLYFVASNQDLLHCSVPRRLQSGVWTMVTVVWKSGADGYCALYVNGERVAEASRAFEGHYVNKGPLLLGTDAATTQARGRSAEALVDEVTLYREPLSDRDVRRLYENQEKDPKGAFARKWEWLERGLRIPLQAAYLPSGERMESRVIFDEDIRWATSREATDQILARVKAAGFNVYIPCVWHGKGTHYPTPITAPDASLTARLRTDDPLEYLVERAHALGIEVHPWFTVVRRESDRYPDWYGDGVPAEAYDVHRPEFRQFIVDLMVDVVQRYDVDGINLDYIRAMGICTSRSCREDYERTSGSGFWLDYALRGVIGAARSRLERWQDEVVGDIVQRTASRAKRLKPKMVISVDGYPVPREAHRPLEGRNEVVWLNDGLIDVVFAMEYRDTIDEERLDAVRRDLSKPERLAVIFANYDLVSRGGSAVPRRGELVAKFADFAQRKWPSRTVAFILFWQMSDDQVAALRNGPFQEPAVPSWHAGHRRASRSGLS